MSKVRNATDGPRYVPLLDREVAAGEAVEVPDTQGDGVSPIVWPEPTWEPVADTPKGKAAASDSTSGKAAG